MKELYVQIVGCTSWMFNIIFIIATQPLLWGKNNYLDLLKTWQFFSIKSCVFVHTRVSLSSSHTLFKVAIITIYTLSSQEEFNIIWKTEKKNKKNHTFSHLYLQDNHQNQRQQFYLKHEAHHPKNPKKHINVKSKIFWSHAKPVLE